VAAGPLFFRAVCIKNTDSLHKTASRLREAEEVDRLAAGKLIHTLHVHDSVDFSSPSDTDSINTILLYATQIKDVRLPPSTYPALLGFLAYHRSNSIRKLDMRMPAHLGPGVVYVGRLNYLINLWVRSSDGLFSQHESRGWVLPRLRHLTWDGSGPEPVWQNASFRVSSRQIYL
jgi:hypothetical protein